MTTFPHLFEPLTIRKCHLKNRIVFAPHGTSQGRSAGTLDNLVAYHRARAEGGVGLIITEAMTVHSSYEVRHHLIAVSDDGCIPELRELADAIHAHDCRMFGQLFHPGRAVAARKDGALIPAFAPSEIPDERHQVMPAPMSRDLIAEIVAAYGEGARRMADADLDGVELIVSHGYLLAQFLNPRTNRRDDEYGGPFDNRLRFVREALAEVRTQVGDDLVVGIRISVDEKDYAGLSPEESIAAGAALSAEGAIDYLSVVGGSGASVGGAVHIVPPMAMAPGYLAADAGRIREAVNVPVLLTGRINQPQVAERIIAEGGADLIGMVRALVCDPAFAVKAEAGRSEDIRACIGCNQACIGHRHMGAVVSCIQHPETGRELTFPHVKSRAPRARRVLVVGGGPGGMKAAAIAAERGHEVSLYERSPRLGGQALLAQLLPGRAEFGGIVTNLAREMELAGVEVKRGVEVNRALVERLSPDAVIVATGAVPYWPDIEGLDAAHAVDAWSVIRGEANVGSSVVVADWRCDWVGMGVAELLARNGCRVRLYVQGIVPGQNLQSYLRDHWIGVLDSLGVEHRTYVRLFGADEDSVYFQHMTNAEAVVCEDVDTLVLAQGHVREASLADALAGWEGAVHVIGDALNPRTAEEAVLEGLEAGMAI